MSNTPDQLSHFDRAANEIHEKLLDITCGYDSKILAACLLNHSGNLLRSLYSTGILSGETITAMIEGAYKNTLEKLPADKMPYVATIRSAPPKAS